MECAVTGVPGSELMFLAYLITDALVFIKRHEGNGRKGWPGWGEWARIKHSTRDAASLLAGLKIWQGTLWIKRLCVTLSPWQWGNYGLILKRKISRRLQVRIPRAESLRTPVTIIECWNGLCCILTPCSWYRRVFLWLNLIIPTISEEEICCQCNNLNQNLNPS